VKRKVDPLQARDTTEVDRNDRTVLQAFGLRPRPSQPAHAGTRRGSHVE
jgi:hypothetical protein